MRNKRRSVVILKAAGQSKPGDNLIKEKFYYSVALSVLVAHAYIHPVKVSISTSKYLNPLHMGIWVKSSASLLLDMNVFIGLVLIMMVF